MIEELLQFSFIMRQSAEFRESLEQRLALLRNGDPKTVEAAEAHGISAGDLEATIDDLRKGEADERERLGATDAPRPADAPPRPQDEPYFPRDPVTCALQLHLEEFFHAHDLVEEPPDLQSLFETRPPITGTFLKADARQEVQARLFDQMGQTDLRFATDWALARLVRAVRRRRPFNPNPAYTSASNRLRVVMAGDWGSGVPRARIIGARMRETLQATPDGFEGMAIHLGDVYYTGKESEYLGRFLKYWPVDKGEESRYKSWSLNGNHDMYGGGWDYFDFLLAQPRFEAQRAAGAGASLFLIENDHWQIFGLDSAYDDYKFDPRQTAWLARERRRAPGKKSLVLTHHQLHSAHDKLDPISPAMRKSFEEAKLFSDKLIDAWIWGHEHRCVVYQPGTGGIPFSCCLGHGGVPVYAFEAAKGDGARMVKWEYLEYEQHFLERFALFGYAALDFDGPKLRLSFRGEDGKEHHSEQVA